MLIDGQEILIGFLHRLLALTQRHRGTTLGIRDHQRPGLVDTITPLGDIVTIQSAAGLISTVLLHQLTLAAHRLLTILPGVIEVREIDAHTDQGTSDTHTSGLRKAHQLFRADGLHKPREDHEENYEEEVIRHLHVVGVDLESRKHRREQQSPQIFPLIGQYDTRYHRRQIGQSPHLPDMPCGDNNKEIGREGPEDTTQCCEMLTEVEGSQQDVESQQIGKDKPHILWQPEMIGVHYLRQQVGRAIRRCHLIGGHTRKERVCPT